MPRKRLVGYGGDTSVPVERSQLELEKLLERNGAANFLRFNGPEHWVVQFFVAQRLVRLLLPKPALDKIPSFTDGGKFRTEATRARELEQLNRQRWRQLLLIVRAKLEAAGCGITTLEREFLADLVLPDGSQVGQVLAPRLAAAYSTGSMPALLGDGGPHVG